MRYLTIALAKGRLAKNTMELFEQIGITCEEMKDPDTRKLIFVNEELKLKLSGITQQSGFIHENLERITSEKAKLQEEKEELLKQYEDAKNAGEKKKLEITGLSRAISECGEALEKLQEEIDEVQKQMQALEAALREILLQA